MERFAVEGKEVFLYPGGEEDAPVVYLHLCAGDGKEVWRALQEGGHRAVTLAAIGGLDWNRDMVPWDNPPVTEKGAPFTAGAKEYLRLLTEEIVPEVEGRLRGAVPWRGLAGYSLAGLFAFYALYRTDLFSRIASVSGSLWFPGFLEYVAAEKMQRKPDRLYLSLGDRECRTGNPYLRTVQERTEQIMALCSEQGIDTTFQLNPGDHFKNAARRTAAGITWLLGQ